ncbi:Fanconi anemia group D2 protein [Planoprotostelium fungivorum]|uniref:Fanconi anemia group D2 protein n=1 Tax=Planoprotostelium fungivorum TaxID=1890364 RepID=A0A2P6NZS1_9EUKA|nr:Fanconi anemia group D2 protein [Planoprotostelium fungivorum]
MSSKKRKEPLGSSGSSKRSKGESSLHLHLSIEDDESSSQALVEETSDQPFKKELLKAGLLFQPSQPQYYIKTDPIQFRKRLENQLRYDRDACNHFTQGLLEHLNSPENLRKSLLSTTSHYLKGDQLKPSSDIKHHDSLIRMLLRIEILQSELVSSLVEKIPEYNDEDTPRDQQSTVLLILNQFRRPFPLRDESSRKFSQKILDVLNVCNLNVQRDIITRLPEMTDDASQLMVVVSLKAMMEVSTELVVPILSALSNLKVKQKLMDEVREVAVQTLESVKMKDVPVVIQYIFETMTTDNVNQVVDQLRRGLNIESLLSQDPDDKSGEILIMEELRIGLRKKKEAANAFLEKIKSVDNQEDHRVIDVWVLVIIYLMPQMKKNVEKIFKSKVSQRQLSENIVSRSLQSFALREKSYANAVIELSEIFLQAGDDLIRRFGSSVYFFSFSSAEDHNIRQAIVRSLLRHVEQGHLFEKDAALDTLLRIVTENAREAAPYAGTVKMILDSIIFLKDAQVRKAFQVIFTLRGEENGLGDDLSIIVRKHLYHSDLPYKRIGVIGGVAMMRRLTQMDPEGRHEKETTKQIIDLLTSLVQSCEESNAIYAFMCDELCRAIQTEKLSRDVIHWIRQIRIGKRWVETFLGDLFEGDNLWMALTTRDEPIPSTISIYPPISASHGNLKLRESLMFLPSGFKLVQTCERKLGNNLQEINLLLGAPIHMFNIEYLEDVKGQSHPEDLSLSLFHAINWFRELLNAFALEKELSMTEKILTRLTNLLTLEENLNLVLAAVGYFDPPGESRESRVMMDKGKGKKKKEEEKDLSSPGTLHCVQLLDACAILSITTAVEEGENPLNGVIELELPSLRYLVECLHSRLKVSMAPRRNFSFLPTAQAKTQETQRQQFHFNKNNTERRMVRRIFPCLITHLTRTSALLLSPQAETPSDWEVHIKPTIVMILESFDLLFTFPEFSSIESVAVLMHILNVITTRSNPPPRLKKLQSSMFHFLLEYEKVAVTDCHISIALYHTLSNVHYHTQDGDRSINESHELSEFAGRMLEKGVDHIPMIADCLDPWQPEPMKSDIITPLLEGHIKYNKDTVSILETLSQELHSFLDEQEKETGESEGETSRTYKTLNSQTFPTYYKVMTSGLVSCLKTTLSKEVPDEEEAINDRISTVTRILKIWQMMVRVVPRKEQKVLTTTCLRGGKSFLESFQKIFPFVQKHFAQKRSLRTLFVFLQPSTRTLQNICGDMKAHRDQNSMIVPILRKLMEAILMEVRNLMVLHNVAYSIGSLKHKNTTGQVVSSQFVIEEEVKKKPKKKKKDKEEEEDKEEEKEEEEEEKEEEEEEKGEEKEEEKEEKEKKKKEKKEKREKKKAEKKKEKEKKKKEKEKKKEKKKKEREEKEEDPIASQEEEQRSQMEEEDTALIDEIMSQVQDLSSSQMKTNKKRKPSIREEALEDIDEEEEVALDTNTMDSEDVLGLEDDIENDSEDI